MSGIQGAGNLTAQITPVQSLAAEISSPGGLAAAITVGTGEIDLESVTRTYTPTEEQQTEVIYPGEDYDGIAEVDITVGAISSTYVGSDIPQLDSSDVTFSGGNVSVPSGFFDDSVTKAMPAGTAGTPTATKGTVSNHAVSITPSVTNTSGYITGSTINGTPVTVSASELVSGTKTISQDGTGIDVTNYATVDVDACHELVVTLSYDEDEEMWVPDRTFAEMIAASTSGDAVVFRSDDDLAIADGWLMLEDADEEYFLYAVISQGEDDGTSLPEMILRSYTYSTGDEIQSLAYERLIAPYFATPQETYFPTESVQTDTITFDTSYGYNGIQEVNITVDAIPDDYVGSSITRRSSSDLSVSGATITAPAGYYSSSATGSVASGTAGTPTATKGTVSNHSVSITPSVTNTTGYITGSTINGTAVSVSASELVSGTYNVTSSGTKDVTNYASASIPAGTEGTPSASKGTVSNHSISVTPSVTNSAGYITGGTKTGTAVTVSASELVSGNKSITSNGTGIDVTNYETVSVSVDDINNQDKTVNPTTSEQQVTYDTGYTGLGTVTVNPIQTETLSLSDFASSHTYYPSSGKYYSRVDTSAILTESKTVSPDETGKEVTPSSGKYLSKVTVEAISSDYVGSGITRRSSSDLTASGATITAPAGYYSSSASKSVASGTAGTPTATKGTVSNHSVSVTPSVTNTTGYITGGTNTGTAVSVSASELVSGNKEITSNGNNIDVTNYATVSVSVSGGGPTLQTKTATYTPSTSQQTDTITPDSGYDGLDEVDITINAMPTMTLPSSTSSSSSGTSKATISRSTSNQYLNIPTGYNGTAQYYTISATPNGTVTAPSSISGTSATVSTGTNTLTLSKSVSVTPNVTTAGYISSGTAGNSSVSLTANVTTKGAATYNTSTTDQTINASQYLTGAQTIKAVTVSGLSAGNIASGVTVKVGDANDDDRIASVTGTLSFVTYYTGSSTPSSSLGSDGDIYLKTS